ncbi:Serine/threonine protein kinase [Handroanthus impetiginosus]|uniref:Serine/threonine protein kinase n=1 Tax=Handroanthus impetiginosus TaxID=429701 RepID=A0A2G9HVH7_9LAMI|nr:Serine/threonine protein kinase [Handroanthus impetiginosus]
MISAISILLISCFPLILAQQPYIRDQLEDCDSRDNSTSVLGYTCNGFRRSCQAYLTFRAQPPYNSVATISTLLYVNSSQLSQLNSVPEDAVFQTNRMVLVPVTCSCSGQNYQINASYVIQAGDTYLIIANNTFQGLSTCQSLEVQNRIPARDLDPGARLTVPLRCACPTQEQRNNGVNYLLSYLVTWGQDVSSISALFGVDMERTLAANELSDTDNRIYPFTSLLVPLQDPPRSYQVTAPQPPPPPSGRSPSPALPPSGSSSRTWVYVVVGVVGGLVLASVVGTIVFCVFFRKRKQKDEQIVSSQSFESVEKPHKKEGDEEDSQGFLESISSIAQSLTVYTFEELKAATQNFSPTSWIKGSVYRGTINGDFAAIKKMNGDVSKEISLLNKINHFNVIRLSGVCFNEGHWYLVYEYASNGPLSDWIHNKNAQESMTWNKRLQIALDVAEGLNYLHRYTSPPYVHKDVNSNNVFLDRDFRAKIANFGLARSAEGQDGQFALTRHIVGTKGYMAPEYLEHGIVSPKLDVYAFGVLMLEILTGKEVSLLYEEGNMQLSEILNQVLYQDDGQENLRKIMDPLLEGKYPPDLAHMVFRLIDDCLKKDPSDRPNMDDVVQSLTRISTSMLSGEWAISISEHQR